MKKLLTLIGAGLFALTFLIIVPGISDAEAAAFMKIADIKGESTDKDHQGWIVVESVSNLPMEPTGSAGTGERQRGSVVVTKTFDKASPKLQEASNSGKRFSKIIIEVAGYGGSRATYLKYELKNVMITSFSVNDPGTSGGVPMETITFSYTKIEWDYKEQHKKKREKKYKKK